MRVARERRGEKAYFKVDPNRQRPPEKHSCVERKLLDGGEAATEESEVSVPAGGGSPR